MVDIGNFLRVCAISQNNNSMYIAVLTIQVVSTVKQDFMYESYLNLDRKGKVVLCVPYLSGDNLCWTSK